MTAHSSSAKRVINARRAKSFVIPEGDDVGAPDRLVKR
jgi:hypothetical protein